MTSHKKLHVQISFIFFNLKYMSDRIFWGFHQLKHRVGNLFAMVGRINCISSLATRKIN